MWVGQGWGLEVRCGASGFSAGVGSGGVSLCPRGQMGKGGEDAILPGPCSSCGDRGGGGLQGGWKGSVRERGPHPRSPLHPEELWPLGGGGGLQPIPRGDPGCPPRLPSSLLPSPQRGSTHGLSQDFGESDSASQTFPWHLKPRTGVRSPCWQVMCDRGVCAVCACDSGGARVVLCVSTAACYVVDGGAGAE